MLMLVGLADSLTLIEGPYSFVYAPEAIRSI